MEEIRSQEGQNSRIHSCFRKKDQLERSYVEKFLAINKRCEYLGQHSDC